MNTERPLAFNINRYSGCGSIAKNLIYELLTDLVDLAETTGNKEARDFLVDYSRDRMFSYYQAKEDKVVTPIFYGVRVCLRPNEYMTVLFTDIGYAEDLVHNIQNGVVSRVDIEDEIVDGAHAILDGNTRHKKYHGYEIKYVHTRKETPTF